MGIASLQDALRDTYGRPLARVELTTECQRNALRLEDAFVVLATAAVLPDPVNATDIDLRGRVAGIPAAARQHFEELLQASIESRSELLERARAHLADIEAASHHNEFIDVSLARSLVERMERLLEQVETLSPITRRIAQAAVLYFISPDDAEDDFDLGGLDDDQAVLSAVVAHLELS